MPQKKKPNELTLTRIYDASVELVWNAWVDPKQAAHWWGPRGFTITTHSKDLKPGGYWRYTMHGPDGTDYPNKTVYHEVEKYKKLVYDHGATDETPPLFRVTVTFEPVGKKTQMQLTMSWPTAEIAIEMQKFIKLANGNSTWDRLAEYLQKENQPNSETEIFVINRSFSAPVEKLFEMWTHPEHLSHWLPPSGATMQFIEARIAEGQESFYKMSFESGLVLYGKNNYLQIVRPERIEYIQSFCDEHGGPSKHPLLPTWPEKMLTRVQFSPEDESQTRVTVTWQPVGQVTTEELKAFVNLKSGMNQGWGQSFDKLEEVLQSN